MKKPYQISPLGDSALIIEWEQRIDETIHQKVMHTYQQLHTLNLPLIRDLIPSYASLTIVYDAGASEHCWQVVSAVAANAADNVTTNATLVTRSIEIPVCYHPSLGPDLEMLAAQRSITTEEVVQLHTQITYTVYMLGFLPGFPYMGTVNERIAAPRLSQPRLKVPAGSVGIAGAQTGIYPLDSPGGWNLIGQTPVRIFNTAGEHPCYFQPGDQVRFIPVSLSDFHELNNRHS